MNKLFGLISEKNINLLKYNRNLFSNQKKYLDYNCYLLSNNDPYIKYDCQTKYTIVYNGYLTNKDELKCKLRTLGYQFKTNKDEEVIINAYIYYKEKCFNYFKGAYIIAIYTQNKIILARDKLGIKPLFYSKNNNYFVFSNEIKLLLKSELVKPIVNEDGLLELFSISPAFTPSLTPFKDIKMLKPGEYLIYENNNLDINLYYKLPVKPYLKSYEEAKLDLKRLLIKSVNEHKENIEYSSLLSGGLDSSIITSLLDKESLINTYFLEYKNNDLYFKRNDFQRSLDIDSAKLVAKELNIKNTILTIDDFTLFNNLIVAMKARDLPGMGDIDSSFYWLCNNIDENYLFTGECSDEIFGGYPWYYRDKTEALFPWIRNVDTRQNLLNKKYQHLNLKDYLKKSFDILIKDYEENPYENNEEKRWRKLTYINIYSFMQQLLYRQETITNANNIVALAPFIDIDLVEFAYNLPSKYKYNLKKEKSILKDAFIDKIPMEIIEKKKNPYPKTFSPIYEELVYKKIKEYLNDSESNINKFFDKEKIIDLINNKNTTIPFYGQLMTNIQFLAYLIQFEEWIKEYNIIFE